MSSLFAVVAGRRTKWLVALVWAAITAGVIVTNLPGKFSDAEQNESTSFLDAVQALPRLEFLNVSRTKVTTEGVERFKAKRPACVIQTEPD